MNFWCVLCEFFLIKTLSIFNTSSYITVIKMLELVKNNKIISWYNSINCNKIF